MRHKVYHNGMEKGTADIYQHNGKAMLEYSCPFEENKVYKLFAQLEGGVLPLGVMLKNGSKFEYKRQINEKKLGRMGEKAEYFYVERHSLGSKATPPLDFDASEFRLCESITTNDHALQNCVKEGGVMAHTYENETYLAAVLEGDKPFALAPFFCLASPVRRGNVTLGVVKLNGENIPTYLNKEGDGGT